MFKIFSTLAVVALCCTTTSFGLQEFRKLYAVRDFEDFLRQTSKNYTDQKEYDYRHTIFLAKKKVNDLVNKGAELGLGAYVMTINPLADMTRAEVAVMTGSKISFRGEQIVSDHKNYVSSQKNDNLPESFDWRELGGVTPPGFQGSCGACWSFATVGAIEGHLFRRTGQLVHLSEQNLVDCAGEFGCEGCEGGFQEYGFEYIRKHGISLSESYPYTQMTGDQCHRNETGEGVTIRDYARIKPGDEDKMKEVIALLGPLACSINAAPITFQMYKGGIYDDEECNKEDVNHSILVVGYGNENGRDYWIVKNSYSENWGEGGFIRIPRNENSFCGIAMECSYPII